MINTYLIKNQGSVKLKAGNYLVFKASTDYLYYKILGFSGKTIKFSGVVDEPIPDDAVVHKITEIRGFGCKKSTLTIDGIKYPSRIQLKCFLPKENRNG